MYIQKRIPTVLSDHIQGEYALTHSAQLQSELDLFSTSRGKLSRDLCGDK